MHSRPERVADSIRQEITTLLARTVQDPGIGFVTITRVKVTADLQLARVFYTTMGDDKAKKETAKALERVKPFLRRQISQRIQLRRAPELEFRYDESIADLDNVERLLQEVREERRLYELANPPEETPETAPEAAPDTAPVAQADGDGGTEPVPGDAGSKGSGDT
ncbi:MAG TPA: 30S ribosome-binding factor RbfA [Vicinamibacterales bacterium]